MGFSGKIIEADGYNAAVGATREVIWSKSGTYTFLDEAVILNIVSSDVGDDVAGVGIQKIMIEGLDANYDEISEEISLDGTTNVKSTKKFLRVNKVYTSQVGANGDAEGNIDIADTTETDYVAYIPAGYNESLQAVFTVPARKDFQVHQIYASEVEAKDSAIYLMFRLTGDNKPDRIKKILLFNNSFVVLDTSARLLFQFTEKTDVWLEGLSDSGSGIISAGMLGTVNYS